MAPEQPEDGTARTPIPTPTVRAGLLGPVRFTGVTSRGLTEETCQKWRYGWAYRGSELVQVAQYAGPDGRTIVAQKYRTREKDFGWVGDVKAAETLFGRHLWRDGGKRVIVTEGELDAMSMSQVLNHRFPVVSLANGAQSAERAVRANLEWLEAFGEVVLLFDQDEAGQAAAAQAAAVLSPGKAKIGRLPLKDANAMLMAGRLKELDDSQWEARVWRPDGILEGDALWAKITAPVDIGSVAYPWSGLQEKLRGLRRKEIVTVIAGTGIGKSTLVRELGVHLVRAGEKVGWIALEESARQTALGMLGIVKGEHLRIEDEPDWAELGPLWDREFRERIALHDHFGSLDSKLLLSRIRYMIKGLGCRWIGLDHITLAMAGNEGENERKDLDVLMTNLRTLVEETGVGLLLVSQLKRRPGSGQQYEDGAMPRLSDMRGSAMLEQTSDVVIGLGRAQSAGDNLADVEVLKNRPIGPTGGAGTLEWQPESGTYREVTLFPEESAT